MRFQLTILLLITTFLFSGLPWTVGPCEIALEKLECKYVLNQAGPTKFDCSGLILFAYEPYGFEFIHHAVDMGYDDRYLTIPYIELLCPGDLIFFDTVQDKDLCDHVGIWLGGNRFVHASSSQKKVVISECTDFYREHFSWGKRLMLSHI